MNRCISKKEYLKKDNSNVRYALYVQNNIKKDDYARLNTGQIVKIIGIRENELNKKAIYFNIYNEDWCDSAAVENFSDNIIDLIEENDIVGYTINYLSEFKVGRVKKYKDARSDKQYLGAEGFDITKMYIEEILTKEKYERNCYRLENNEC